MGKRGPKPKTEGQKQLRSLMQMALDEGHEPGLFLVQRMAETVAMLRDWKEHLDRGHPPEEMAGMKLNDARKLYAREAADAAKLELAMMEFFHPKLRSTDAHVDIEGEVSLYDIMTRGRK